MSKPKPVVGFIILTHNSSKYIRQCYYSIISCKNISPIIVIVDNGSTDYTVQFLHELQNHQNTHCIFLNKNLGTTKSRNIGIKKLLSQHPDYICVLDSDTVINANAIMNLIQALDSDSLIALVGPTMYNDQNQKARQITARKFPNLQIKLAKAIPFQKAQSLGEQWEHYSFNNKQNIVDADYLLSACWLMRSNTFKEIGEFDEKIFYAPEDVDYCRRIWLKGKRCCLVQNAVIIHEYQRLSKQKFFSKINLEHVKGLIYYFHKYHYIFNAYKTISNGTTKL